MNIVLVQELKPYSLKKIKKWLEKDDEKVKNILLNLLELNIVKKIKAKTNVKEIEKLLEIESLEEISLSLEDDIYFFKYVGILMIDDCYIFSYPKYIKNIYEDKKDNYKKFIQILEVIKKYNSSKFLQGLEDKNVGNIFNLLGFTLELLEDYYRNGLYSNEKLIIEENGEGEILWDKTINEKNFYFSNGAPIYLDLYTIKTKTDENDLFNRLHRCILSTCCKKTRDILKILNIEEVSFHSEKLEDFGNKDYLIYKLHQELTQQFITAKQEILYKMINFIEENYNIKTSNNISFIGTNNFNLVWEEVCSYVMGNCLNKSLFELGLISPSDISKYTLLKNIIPKSQWTHYKSERNFFPSGTLIPDLINIKGNKFSIYDAKYYNIKFNEKGIKNQPGISDISKQHLYELAYKRFVDINNLKVEKNAFLIPSDEENEEIIGDVKFDIFNLYDDFKLKNILIILKPCYKMFEQYLK